MPESPQRAREDFSRTEPAESTYSGQGWQDKNTSIPLVDHPLLRGLLMELPPKGAVPAPEYLDRWFEAARSILELLYMMDAPRR